MNDVPAPPARRGRFDGRQLASVLAVIGMVALGAFTIALTVAAVHGNERINRLRHHGVVVSITVTGCTGEGTGMGRTVTAYRCRGTFTLDGHRYNEVIRGSNTHHFAGDIVKGVTDPADPADLSTAQAAATERTSSTPFVLPGVLLVVLLLALVVGRRKRLLGSQARSRR